MDAGDAIFLVMGVSFVLPAGARLAGNAGLAGRMDAIPRIAFAAVCLAIAFLPQVIFRDAGGAAMPDSVPVLVARVVFSVMGSYLTARGILRLWRLRRGKG